MIHLDTNVLVRFFTKDDPQKAILVKKLLEKEKSIFVCEVVLPEIEYVLLRVYKAKRIDLITVYKFLASRTNIKLTPKERVAIEIFEKSSLDMADCLIIANSEGCKLASFDKKLLAVKTVKNYW